MIAATSPAVPLTVPLVRTISQQALAQTLAASNGRGALADCHLVKTDTRYGFCHFAMRFTGSSGKRYRCTGTIQVRRINQTPDVGYKKHGVSCNGKVVN